MDTSFHKKYIASDFRKCIKVDLIYNKSLDNAARTDVCTCTHRMNMTYIYTCIYIPHLEE